MRSSIYATLAAIGFGTSLVAIPVITIPTVTPSAAWVSAGPSTDGTGIAAYRAGFGGSTMPGLPGDPSFTLQGSGLFVQPTVCVDQPDWVACDSPSITLAIVAYIGDPNNRQPIDHAVVYCEGITGTSTCNVAGNATAVNGQTNVPGLLFQVNAPAGGWGRCQIVVDVFPKNGYPRRIFTSVQLNNGVYTRPAYYVDYVNGSDSNPGTPASPWQHLFYAVAKAAPATGGIVCPVLYLQAGNHVTSGEALATYGYGRNLCPMQIKPWPGITNNTSVVISKLEAANAFTSTSDYNKGSFCLNADLVQFYSLTFNLSNFAAFQAQYTGDVIHFIGCNGFYDDGAGPSTNGFRYNAADGFYGPVGTGILKSNAVNINTGATIYNECNGSLSGAFTVGGNGTPKVATFVMTECTWISWCTVGVNWMRNTRIEVSGDTTHPVSNTVILNCRFNNCSFTWLWERYHAERFLYVSSATYTPGTSFTYTLNGSSYTGTSSSAGSTKLVFRIPGGSLMPSFINDINNIIAPGGPGGGNPCIIPLNQNNSKFNGNTASYFGYDYYYPFYVADRETATVWVDGNWSDSVTYPQFTIGFCSEHPDNFQTSSSNSPVGQASYSAVVANAAILIDNCTYLNLIATGSFVASTWQTSNTFNFSPNTNGGSTTTVSVSNTGAFSTYVGTTVTALQWMGTGFFVIKSDLSQYRRVRWYNCTSTSQVNPYDGLTYASGTGVLESSFVDTGGSPTTYGSAGAPASYISTTGWQNIAFVNVVFDCGFDGTSAAMTWNGSMSHVMWIQCTQWRSNLGIFNQSDTFAQNVFMVDSIFNNINPASATIFAASSYIDNCAFKSTSGYIPSGNNFSSLTMAIVNNLSWLTYLGIEATANDVVTVPSGLRTSAGDKIPALTKLTQHANDNVASPTNVPTTIASARLAWDAYMQPRASGSLVGAVAA